MTSHLFHKARAMIAMAMTLAATVALACGQSLAATKPNIVIILADDLGYGLQTTRSIVGGSDHFGIRTVRDARYRYIRNLTPEATFQNLTTKDRTFKTWIKMAAAGDTNAQQLVHDYQHRPAEELYDCEADSWNRHNLVTDPKLADKLAELRTKLDAWMKQQGDTGQDTEMKAHERMPRKRSAEDAANTD